MRRRAVLLAAVALGAAPARAAGARVLLIRHALTDPGTGDPPGFVAGRCETQRNLNDEGRAQARRLGAKLRSIGLAPQRVRSSAWCRCVDTATLAFGRAETWDALASLFGAREHAAAQSAQLQRELEALPAGRLEAWVSHGATIVAWTGHSTAMGEALLVEAHAGAVRLIERITA